MWKTDEKYRSPIVSFPLDDATMASNDWVDASETIAGSAKNWSNMPGGGVAPL